MVYPAFLGICFNTSCTCRILVSMLTKKTFFQLKCIG
jgi:hypothetical protein